MQQEPDSRGGRLMMVVVGAMGVLIVVGFAILLVEIGRRMFTTKPAATEPAATRPMPAAPARGFGQVEVRIPEGARVESLASAGDRIIAHVRTRDGASLAYVVDPATGALLGVIRFPASPPDGK